MLVHTMTPEELRIEIFADHKVLERTGERLMFEYDRERRRLKVGKEKVYAKVYPIKTKRKNTWLIFMLKHPEEEKYCGIGSLATFWLVYYYSAKGLRVFEAHEKTRLFVYNGHLYKRYNERMGLGLSSPLEIVKHFHLNNDAMGTTIISREGKDRLVAVCRDGLLLGEFQEVHAWEVYKTFVTRADLSSRLEETEREMIDGILDEINEEVTKYDYNPKAYKRLKRILKELKNPASGTTFRKLE